jgi:hypothetical protein
MVMASCAKNPFSSRDSEVPFKEAGTFIPPTSPQIVLENLRLAYTEMVISNFMQTLDSNFVFSFDYIEGSLIDTSWGYSVEINLTDNMFADFLAAGGDMQLEIVFEQVSGQPDILLDTTATLIRSYTLTVSDSSGAALESYEGVSEFVMTEAAFEFWALRHWEDLHLDTRSPSWADLKSRYR